MGVTGAPSDEAEPNEVDSLPSNDFFKSLGIDLAVRYTASLLPTHIRLS